ncbi:hypothetical protein GCM10008171_28890 [Methylopila jiangsuensis]|uniref:Piwi domain-containing protein n=1 Tax=Methylopila jiangsuensis TaxID=586230 RepID=A0A9W6N4S8_9HYPH|nr:hypothetical protein [Methylopila jiangsuensis]MDR6284977.1 hypothetical protein [Methylopila jiangsuensis]GLK77635.1 hypothetical protein GCM10008171_28890 [Methylopila jiangsuensis]
MNLRPLFLEEPLLEFGSGQTLEHPQDGLFLYGPVRAGGAANAIHVGVIGARAGVALVRAWLAKINGRIPVLDPTKLHTNAWPGFQAAFGVRLVEKPMVTICVPSDRIGDALGRTNKVDAVRSTVKLFEDAILEHLRTDERRPDVWLVVVPESVFRYGRPEVAAPKDAIRSTLMSKKTASGFLKGGGALFPDMAEEAETYLFARNFHHQLKSQLLDRDAVIQVIRETTLDPAIETDRLGRPVRSVQEPAKIAWNLSTTLYFKGARSQPWRLAQVRPGVCYVGLVFKIDPSPAQVGEACCAAQMFLDSGDGVVFRGALGPWYSSKNREFHLRPDAAEALIRQVIEAYTKEHGAPPKELFIHGRQRFSKDEWDGFCAAIPAETERFVGVRIRPTQDLRLFRADGPFPVLRGSAVLASHREGYLWTTGYAPRLRVYPGFETPKPILIEITHSRGGADLETVMRDVLGLTKVNYNACDYASGLPVTLKFADRVGEILLASPRGREAPPLPFRFYI